jgi:hypothetical protein
MAGLLGLPADRVTLVLNPDAGSGNKLVLVDEAGGEDGRKFVCRSPSTFSRLLSLHDPARISLVKIKGRVSAQHLRDVKDAMARLASPSSGIREFNCKAASLSSSEDARVLADLLLSSLPPSCNCVLAKKTERAAKDLGDAAGLAKLLETLVVAGSEGGAAGAGQGAASPPSSSSSSDADAVKMKAKLGKSVVLLADKARADLAATFAPGAGPAEYAASEEEARLGLVAVGEGGGGGREGSLAATTTTTTGFPITSIKIRGPLTLAAAQAAANVLSARGNGGIKSVKCVRYWLPAGVDAAQVAAILLEGTGGGAGAATLDVKRKGVGTAEARLDKGGEADVARMLAEYAAPPSS